MPSFFVRNAFSLLGALALGLSLTSQAQTAPLRIFAAGSLSGVIEQLIETSGLPADAFAKPVYGPSGLLTQRLEKGEMADLFASADLAGPTRLAAARRGTLIVPFVKNRMCLAAQPSVRLTSGNLLEKMLSPEFRLATSTPGDDPGGDYALAVFRRAEALQPGADKTLTNKALHLVGGPNTMVAVEGRSPSATIFLGNHADLFLYYCSSAAGLLKEVPGLTSLPLPESLEVHPVYGLAVMPDEAAARFALFVVSLEGQRVLVRAGFEPLVTAK
jgi:molybdate transport system substrate-binding protein